jgi:hypothetical protein
MMHPGAHHLSFPRGVPRLAHVVGSGAVSPCGQGTLYVYNIFIL